MKMIYLIVNILLITMICDAYSTHFNRFNLPFKAYTTTIMTRTTSLNMVQSTSNSTNSISFSLRNNKLIQQFQISLKDAKQNPLKYLSIPLSAAIIGYITNWVGVKMLFYPIEWAGIPFKRWEGQPLGLIGWQGIVLYIQYYTTS